MTEPGPTTPSPSPAAKPAAGSAPRVLIGCLVALVVVGLVAVGLTAAWVLSPGRQVGPERVISPRAEALIRFDGMSGDAGVKALVTHIVLAAEAKSATERKGAERLPPGMRWIEDFRIAADASNVSSALDLYLPEDAVLSFAPNPEGSRLQPFFVANFPRFVRPVRFLVERSVADASDTERYRGRTLLGVNSDLAFAFVDGTLLAGDVLSLRSAIDRLDEPPSPHPLFVALEGAERSAGRDWDVDGVASPPRAGLAMLSAVGFEALAEDGSHPFPELHTVRWALDAASEDALGAELAFEFESTGAAAAALPALEARWADVTTHWAQRGLTVAATTMRDGPRLTTRVDATGLAEALDAWLASSEQDEGSVEEPASDESP